MGTIIKSFIGKGIRNSVWFALLFAIIPVFLQWPLFWDNLPYVGGIADYFYQHGVRASLFNLPKDWDVAHSPLFALLLANGWHLIGKSLLSSYLIQAPFVFVSFYYLFELFVLFESRRVVHIALLLLLIIDTCIFTQINQLGYEWIMLAPFMFTLFNLVRSTVNGTDLNISLWRRFGVFVLFLPLTQLRGINLLVLLVFVSTGLNFIQRGFQYAISYFFRKEILMLIIGASLTFSWLLLHKVVRGYWTNASGVAWSGEHLIPSNLIGFLYGIVLSLWRIMDYGFVIYFILAIGIAFVSWKKRKTDTHFKILLLMSLSIIVLAIQFSFFDIPICHRYFLLFRMVLPLLMLVWVNQFTKRIKISLFIVIFISVLSGDFWQYPDGMANGREVQVSSIRYFPLRDSVSNYMRLSKINPKQVASHFPICVSDDWIYLTSKRSNALCADIDTAKTPKYIIYSNFSNGFTIDERNQIAKMKKVRSWRNGPLYLDLVQCP